MVDRQDLRETSCHAEACAFDVLTQNMQWV